MSTKIVQFTLPLLARAWRIALPLLMLAGCSDPYTVAAKSIDGSERTLVALRTGLLEYNKMHEEEIVNAGPAREAVIQRLALYRAVRDKIVVGLLEVQRLVVVAEMALLVAQAGQSSDTTALASAVADLVAAVTKATASFVALRAPGGN